jgi:hypothetical protein
MCDDYRVIYRQPGGKNMPSYNFFLSRNIHLLFDCRPTRFGWLVGENQVKLIIVILYIFIINFIFVYVFVFFFNYMCDEYCVISPKLTIKNICVYNLILARQPHLSFYCRPAWFGWVGEFLVMVFIIVVLIGLWEKIYFGFFCMCFWLFFSIICVMNMV